MASDHIRYDILAQDALRGVVRTVLVDAAKNGLPGEHHFYITFDTHAEGVHVSPRMLAQYPEEMTIVLQHQFWDLVVADDVFEVGLSFHGVAERLKVPFAAITDFTDPAAQFRLRFEEIEEAKAEQAPEGAAPAGKARAVEPAEQMEARPAPVAAVPIPEPSPASPDSPEPDKTAGAEVVRLDRFRKK
jgi:hypothetical protein